MNPNEVGIVVIGRNEGQRLTNCLRSVKKHSVALIYVDSGSRDGSPTAAEEMGAHVVRLREDRPFTAARARNEGVKALKSLQSDILYVQFIDGDCELADGWLPKAFEFMEQRPDVAVVCGRRRECHPEASIYNSLFDIEWNTPVGETIACGGDSFVRLASFDAVGGFRSASITGEEPELCVRLRERGFKIWRIDSEMTRHDAAMTKFSQWWRRVVRSGYGIGLVYELHKSSPFGICRRDRARALFWAGALPVAIALLALMKPILIWTALVYPIQICRIAVVRGPFEPKSWIYASFMMIGKFAEFEGICVFYWRQWRREQQGLIEYK